VVLAGQDSAAIGEERGLEVVGTMLREAAGQQGSPPPSYRTTRRDTTTCRQNWHGCWKRWWSELRPILAVVWAATLLSKPPSGR